MSVQPQPPETTNDNPVIVYDVQLSHPEDKNNTPFYFRDSPIHLLWHDLGVLIENSREIVKIFSPFPTVKDRQRDLTLDGFVLQVVFTIISLGVTFLLCTTFTIGLPTPIVAALLATATLVLMSRWQGKVELASVEDPEKHKHEAWLFVNGIATSASGLQLILDHLYKVFGRQVIGIHNRTFGIWWDLIESVLQREFLFPTEDVRVGYQTVCEKLRNPDIHKIVLMAHSQGGIILSTWVDQLLADFAAEELLKVEIYTFAAAANHFSAPWRTVNGEKRYVFGAVEHFANTRDYVARIGVLAFAPPSPTSTPGVLPAHPAEGRFAGRIFSRQGTTGHMFLSHYLRAGSSFLDHPTVRQYSQLVKYMGGHTVAPEKRQVKETVDTVTMTG